MGIVGKRNGAALLRITGYAGHAGIPLRLKCTGDGGLVCRDEGKNISLEGPRPIEGSLIQRDERSLASLPGFTTMVFHIPCERRKPYTAGNGAEDTRIDEPSLTGR